jgi:hypothetical protein
MSKLPINTCPKCRRIMRRWALDYRGARSNELKTVCLLTALEWRSGPCIHGERRIS